MDKSIVAIIQARTSSKRLPDKVLLPLINKPMILFQLERIKGSKILDKIIVATSDESTDDNLARLVTEEGYLCFRGSLKNVLKRYADCIKNFPFDVVVRITGDCPLMDPKLIDEIVLYYLKNDFQYISNSLDEKYLSVPDGLDIEVFDSSILAIALEKAKLESQKEHVTPWFRTRDAKIKWKHFIHSKVRKFYRLTVDDLVDYEVICSIVKALYVQNKNFDLDEVIDFLIRNPHIAKKNINTIRNEGYLNSLKTD